jgi:hypothetical protein
MSSAAAPGRGRKPKASTDVKRSLGVDGTPPPANFEGVANGRGMSVRGERVAPERLAAVAPIVEANAVKARAITPRPESEEHLEVGRCR